MNALLYILITVVIFLIFYIFISKQKEKERNENLLNKLIIDNNGYSTTNAMVVGTFILVVLIVFTTLAIMIIDTLFDGISPSDMTGISLILGSCATLLGAVGFVKVYKTKYGKKNETDREFHTGGNDEEPA